MVFDNNFPRLVTEKEHHTSNSKAVCATVIVCGSTLKNKLKSAGNVLLFHVSHLHCEKKIFLSGDGSSKKNEMQIPQSANHCLVLVEPNTHYNYCSFSSVWIEQQTSNLWVEGSNPLKNVL